MTQPGPQAAYHLFVISLQSRWTFLQRVFAANPQLFDPLETVIVQSLLPALTGHILPIEGDLRKLLSLPVKSGGLAVGISSQQAEAEHQLCFVSTELMVQSVLSRTPGPACAVIASCRTLSSAVRTERRAQQQSVLTRIKPSLPDQQRLLVEVAGDGGVSTWLGTPPTV